MMTAIDEPHPLDNCEPLQRLTCLVALETIKISIREFRINKRMLNEDPAWERRKQLIADLMRSPKD